MRTFTLWAGAAMLLLTLGCARFGPSAAERERQAAQPRPQRPGALESGWNAVRSPFSRTSDLLSGKTPLKAARMMEDAQFPDQRRMGINELATHSFGRREPYTRRYRQIAESDPDFTVRAAAIRALNRSRDREATPVFIKSLGDESQWVRLEAAKALANVPDPAALEPLTRIVSSSTENKDVRIAAADALRHYKDAGAARALVAAVGGRDFGVAWQARWSLRTMTGRDLRYNDQAWLEYLAREHPFG